MRFRTDSPVVPSSVCAEETAVTMALSFAGMDVAISGILIVTGTQFDLQEAAFVQWAQNILTLSNRHRIDHGHKID